MFTKLKQKIIYKLTRVLNKAMWVPEKGDLVKGIFLNPKELWLVMEVNDSSSGYGKTLTLLNLNSNHILQFGWTEDIEIVTKADDQ